MAAVASVLGTVAVVVATTAVVVAGLDTVVLAVEGAGGCALEETGVGVRLESLTGDLTGVLLRLETPATKSTGHFN